MRSLPIALAQRPRAEVPVAHFPKRADHARELLLASLIEREKQAVDDPLQASYRIAILQFQLGRPDSQRLRWLVDRVELRDAADHDLGLYGTILCIAASGFHALGLEGAYRATQARLRRFDARYETHFARVGIATMR